MTLGKSSLVSEPQSPERLNELITPTPWVSVSARNLEAVLPMFISSHSSPTQSSPKFCSSLKYISHSSCLLCPCLHSHHRQLLLQPAVSQCLFVPFSHSPQCSRRDLYGTRIQRSRPRLELSISFLSLSRKHRNSHCCLRAEAVG